MSKGVASGDACHQHPPAPVLVECDGISYSYDGEYAVEDITLNVHQGELMVILGPNGSGKSTLLRLMLGLLHPDSGEVRLFGTPANRFRDWSRIGYVPQVVEELTGRFPATVEELVIQGAYAGFSPLAIFRRRTPENVLRALDTAGIPHLARKRLSDLSVGQQQRALIARAIVRNPELLVMDEPVAGVDVGGQDEFYSFLKTLVARGMAVVLVSHDVGVALREATSVACINKTLVFHGPPHKITGKEFHELYGLPIDILLHDDIHEHR